MITPNEIIIRTEDVEEAAAIAAAANYGLTKFGFDSITIDIDSPIANSVDEDLRDALRNMDPDFFQREIMISHEEVRPNGSIDAAGKFDSDDSDEVESD